MTGDEMNDSTRTIHRRQTSWLPYWKDV